MSQDMSSYELCAVTLKNELVVFTVCPFGCTFGFKYLVLRGVRSADAGKLDEIVARHQAEHKGGHLGVVWSKQGEERFVTPEIKGHGVALTVMAREGSIIVGDFVCKTCTDLRQGVVKLLASN